MTINPIVKIAFFSKILLVHGFQHPMPSISQGTKVLQTKWPLSFPIVNLSIFCHHPFWVHFFLSCPHHYLLFPIDVQPCCQDHILITSMLPTFLLSACCCSPTNPCYLRKINFIVLTIILQNCSKKNVTIVFNVIIHLSFKKNLLYLVN
jgi:hypothetical protein